MHQDPKKLMSHLGQACMRRGADGVSSATIDPLRYKPWLSYCLTFIKSSGVGYATVYAACCCERDQLAFQQLWYSCGVQQNCDLFTPHSGPSLLNAQALFNGSLRTLQFTLDQPKPRPRPLVALVPLPILLPLADGMVPLPLPTDVPAAV